ncbi:MAG: mannitol dehydrogenase family protein [Pseudomonadota bacterium]
MNGWPRVKRHSPPPKPGIVHLGLGAFFRSHGALVIEDAMQYGGGDWGIFGASLRSPDIRNRLSGQDFVYTAVKMAPEGQYRRLIHALCDVIFAPDSPDSLIARMADPSTRIVSLTVTEKGYCHIPSTGDLDRDHPDVQHDAANALPRSAIGFIVRALQLRRAAGVRPFTVLSCDNLPNNGLVARNVVCGLAKLIDPELTEWISREGRFPATMVDRIVPAATEKNIEQLAAEVGCSDAAPVFHEPFLQWVIEDSFVDGMRPAFETVVGVQMVRDVAPFELMKIRMLNGTHSALAYLGYLAGHETISDTVSNPVFAKFLHETWLHEIIPSLEPPEGINLQRYADELLGRYANPAIRHRTWQIAMDGSQKLPQRILGTIADNVAAGRPYKRLALAVAAWMRYVGGLDEHGRTIDVCDPLADRLELLSRETKSSEEKVNGLLSISEVFGSGVDASVRFAIQSAYARLVAKGAEASAREIE